MAQNKKAKTSSIAEMEVAICRDLIGKLDVLVGYVSTGLRLLEDGRADADLIEKRLPLGGLSPARAQLSRVVALFGTQREFLESLRDQICIDELKDELKRVLQGTAVASVLVIKLRTRIDLHLDTQPGVIAMNESIAQLREDIYNLCAFEAEIRPS